MLQSEKRAELERRKGELNARKGLVLDPSVIDKELEKVKKELIVMDISSATKVGATVAKQKDSQVKLESKGQESYDKLESKGRDDGLELEEDLKGITLEDQLHEDESIDLKKAKEEVDKLIASKDYEKAKAEIKRALQFCNRGINKGKYAEDEYELFIRLGNIYLQYGEIYDVSKAAAIYQYTKKLVEKYLNNNPEKLKAIEARIQSVESVFLDRIKAAKLESKARDIDIASPKDYSARLQEHRELVKKRLTEIENLGIKEGQEELDERGLQKRASEVEAIYGETRGFFIGRRNASGELEKPGLVNDLINDCIKELGGVPRVGVDKHECGYSIFVMGSLALGTMTPWSDIEFGILIEEWLTPEEGVRVKEYFRQLTTLLYIKVVNFGETPLRMMGVTELNNFKITEKSDAEHNWFFDDLTRSGFSFDGPHWHACKTPLGRAKGYQKARVKESGTALTTCQPFELIGTVRDFAGFYQDTTWVKEDPQLVQGLGHVLLVSGQNSLLLQYQKMLREHGRIIESLAFKLLKEDSQLLDPFNQIMDWDKEGQLLNVKKEIYRFPDRMSVALMDCLKGNGSNSWEVVRSLSIGVKARSELEGALSVSTEMRLRTYASNNGQREDMAAIAKYDFTERGIEKGNISKEVFCLKDLRLLYRYYFIVLGLSLEIRKLQDYQSLRSLDGSLVIKDPAVRGYVYKRFLKYSEAIKEFEKVKDKKSYVINVSLTRLYSLMGRNVEAIKLNAEIGSYMRTEDTVQARIDKAVLLSNQGSILQNSGNYKRALECYEECLRIRREIYRGDHEAIVTCLNNKSIILEKLGKHNEAFKCINEGLEMMRRISKGDHIKIAILLNTKGNLFKELSKFNKALICFKQSLEMMNRIFKGYNPMVINVLQNIAMIQHNLDKFEIALEHHKKCLKMKRGIYDGDHLDIVLSLMNIGQVLEDLGKYPEALKYHKDSLAMLRRIHKGDHPKIAGSLNSIGETLEKLGKHEEALKYYKESQEMTNRIYKGDHKDKALSLKLVATALENLGHHEKALGRDEKALDHYKKALEEIEKCEMMLRRIYKEGQSDVAAALTSKGNILRSLDRRDEALKCYKESLRIERKIHKGDHSSIAVSLSNIGMILGELGNYEQALKEYNESLEMRRRIYKKDHPDIADSLYNIGVLHYNHENLAKAAEYFEQTLKMQERVLGENHPKYKHTVTCLNRCQEERVKDSGRMNEILNKKGIEQFRSKNYGAAIETFSQLINSNPAAGYFYSRGRAYHENGKYPEAIRDYHEVLKMEPSHSKAREQLEKLTKLGQEQARLNEILNQCFEGLEKEHARLDEILNQSLEQFEKGQVETKENLNQTKFLSQQKIVKGPALEPVKEALKEAGKNELGEQHYAAIQIQRSWRKYVQDRKAANSPSDRKVTNTAL